ELIGRVQGCRVIAWFGSHGAAGFRKGEAWEEYTRAVGGVTTRRAGKCPVPFAPRSIATELLHLPDKPAGVGNKSKEAFLPAAVLATELLHLPDKPAGVGSW